MPRSAGPLRTLLFVLVAAMAGLLLGLGAFTVASALGAGQEQNLGDPVRFDPARVSVTPSPNPTLTPSPTLNPTLNPLPEQVVPAPPSPADDDADDTDDSDDDSDDSDDGN